MPIFEFQCVKCNAIQEKLVKRDCASIPCEEQPCDGICHIILSRPGLVYEKKYYKDGRDWGNGIP